MQQFYVSTNIYLLNEVKCNSRKCVMRPCDDLNSTLAREWEMRLGILWVLHNMAERSGLKYDTIDMNYCCCKRRKLQDYMMTLLLNTTT